MTVCRSYLYRPLDARHLFTCRPTHVRRTHLTLSYSLQTNRMCRCARLHTSHAYRLHATVDQSRRPGRRDGLVATHLLVPTINVAHVGDIQHSSSCCIMHKKIYSLVADTICGRITSMRCIAFRCLTSKASVVLWLLHYTCRYRPNKQVVHVFAAGHDTWLDGFIFYSRVVYSSLLSMLRQQSQVLTYLSAVWYDLINVSDLYTLWTRKKGGSTFCDHNSGKSWSIFIIFAPL